MKKIVWFVFPIVFVALFFVLKQGAASGLDQAIKTMPAVKYFGQTAEPVKAPIEKFGALAGLGLWVLGLVATLVISLVFRLVGLKRVGVLLGLVISFGLLSALGGEFVWLEERRTILSAAIPLYFGFPLFVAGLATSLLALIAYFPRKIEPVNPNALKTITLLLLVAISTSGCTLIGDLQYIGCSVANDPHCYQEAAVSTSDESKCDKVTPPAEFAKLGSNPPKDKCLTMIAQNEGNTSKCNSIKGGIGSYTKEECIQGVVEQKLESVKTELDKTGNGKSATPEQIADMQKKLEEARQVSEMMSSIQKGLYQTQLTTIKSLAR